MINQLIESGILKSKSAIKAFNSVKREDFVRPEYREHAYENIPLPMFEMSTISQPLTVAAMTEALDVKKDQKILEIGTGSGYQAAILSILVGPKGKVITIEINEEVYEFGKGNLKDYPNVKTILSDGSLGYAKEAQYDRIVITASASAVPKELIEQLAVGGIMMIPVNDKMFRIIKIGKNKIRKEFMGYYAFVPLREK
ncbi:MAG: protein-L-isoaspartate(D-aspartate) O-methyltransferase [Candidatus Aenigmarchaeota archaeon]|nr:protein-L-isoaspartate(D-aspartate) O-methyltransferase [Candidatus Aenigmarchaeota archaeon]